MNLTQRLKRSLMPTAGEKAALTGTSGTASAVNKYVTDTDYRLNPPAVRRIVVADMQPHESWSADGTATNQADTVHFKTGTQGLELEVLTGSNDFHSLVLDKPVKVYGAVGIWFYAPDPTKILSIQLRIYPANGEAPYYSEYITLAGNHYYGLKAGDWWFVNINPRKFTLGAGAPVWGASGTWIEKIRIRCQAQTGNTTLTVGGIIAEDGLDVGTGTPVGAICLGFDGAYDTQYSVAFTDMQARGWPGTEWVALGGVDVTSPGSVIGATQMTLTQLIEMYNAGWDVAHQGSYTANIFSVATTEADFRASMSKNRFLFSSLGFHRGLNIASWGGHHGICDDTNVPVILKELGYVSSRGVVAWSDVYPNIAWGYGPEGWTTNNVWNPGDYYQVGSDGPNNKTVADAESMITDVVNRRTFAHLYSHQIMPDVDWVAGNVKQSVWDAMIAKMDEYVASGQLIVISYTQYLAMTLFRNSSVQYGTDGSLQMKSLPTNLEVF